MPNISCTLRLSGWAANILCFIDSFVHMLVHVCMLHVSVCVS